MVSISLLCSSVELFANTLVAPIASPRRPKHSLFVVDRRGFLVVDVIVSVGNLMRWMYGALLASRAIENRHCRRLQQQTGEPERAAPNAAAHRFRLDTTCARNRPRQQRHMNNDAGKRQLQSALLIRRQSCFQLRNRRQFQILKLERGTRDYTQVEMHSICHIGNSP